MNIGDLNDQVLELEQVCNPDEPQHPVVAKHMLIFMITFTHFQFTYAHFSTTDTTSDQLFSTVWEAIRQLEFCGFKVIAVT